MSQPIEEVSVLVTADTRVAERELARFADRLTDRLNAVNRSMRSATEGAGSLADALADVNVDFDSRSVRDLTRRLDDAAPAASSVGNSVSEVQSRLADLASSASGASVQQLGDAFSNLSTQVTALQSPVASLVPVIDQLAQSLQQLQAQATAVGASLAAPQVGVADLSTEIQRLSVVSGGVAPLNELRTSVESLTDVLDAPEPTSGGFGARLRQLLNTRAAVGAVSALANRLTSLAASSAALRPILANFDPLTLVTEQASGLADALETLRDRTDDLRSSLESPLNNAITGALEPLRAEAERLDPAARAAAEALETLRDRVDALIASTAVFGAVATRVGTALRSIERARSAGRELEQLRENLDNLIPPMVLLDPAVNSVARALRDLGNAQEAGRALGDVADRASDLVTPLAVAAPLLARTERSLRGSAEPARDLSTAFESLNDHLRSAAETLGSLVPAFTALGPAIRGVARSVRDLNDQLETLGDRLNGLLRPLLLIVPAAFAASAALNRIGGNGRLGGEVDLVGNRVRRLTESLRGTSGAGDGVDQVSTSLDDLARSSAGAAASSGGLGLALPLIATGALAALPAVSALIPALAGVVGVSVAAKSIFGGLADTATLAATDHKAYAKALKGLNKPQQDFVEQLVDTRKEFKGFSGELQKAVLPTFTKELKNSGPFIDVLKNGLRDAADVIKKFGTTFGNLFSSNRFQKALRDNFSLGTGFIQTLIDPLSKLTLAVVEFGAKAKPALDAFGTGAANLVGSGLPGLFAGLAPGIKGAAQLFSGLFDALNRLLPAFGELSGAIAASTGPAFGEFFRLVGTIGAGAFRLLAVAFTALRPVFGEVAGLLTVLRISLGSIASIATNVASVLIGSLWPSFRQASSAVGPLQSLAMFLEANRGAVLEFTRIASQGILTFATQVIQNIPVTIGLFRSLVSNVLDAFEGILTGATTAFGWIPGVGSKLKDANTAFQNFRINTEQSLSQAEAATQEFANRALPRLQGNRLRLDISNWTAQIDVAKGKLSDKNLPPSKRTTLLATIRDLEDKVRRAKQALDSVARNRTATVTFRGVFAATSADRNANGVPDSIEARAGGGLVGGRGTGTSDSNLIRASKGEFVIRAAAVRAYGVRALEAINAMRLPAVQAGGAVGSAGSGGTAGASSTGRSVGGSLVQGLVKGILDGLPQVRAATQRLAQGSVNAAESTLGIGSPSKRFAAVGRDLGRGFISGITSTAARIRSITNDLANDIIKAFQGRRTTRDDRLVAFVDAQNRRLVSLARQRDATIKRIADANKFAADTTRSALDAFSLQNIVQENNGSVSRSSIFGGLVRSVKELRAFSAAVDTLRRKGLRKDLLAQIIGLGPGQGGELAASLSKQSVATIRQINAQQAQLAAAARSLGRTSADVLFDAGRQAGRGFLTGLRAQQKQIEGLMLSIAKGMQRSIKRALGIRSPSRVFEVIGDDTGAGLEKGFLARVPSVLRAVTAAAGSLGGAAVPDLGGTVSAVRPSPAARVSPTVVNLTVVNRGVVGSRTEVLNWLTESLDTLSRQRRLPA